MHTNRRPLFSTFLPLLLGLSCVSTGFAQTGLLFDGDFESGTFQGWTPGGENGGFATVAAKGSCFSGNDTTAISFNGDPTSNYAALLRSNAAGETGSVATLRSQPFEAGNGVIFSALTETLSDNPGEHPVDLVVKIINSAGEVVSEQPYRTAIIQLAAGCPSEQRDTAFSGHFIDTHHLAGEQITIEFNQNTRNQGSGYFTLIDNVVFIDSSSFLLSTSQPRAVAGTGITNSGTFFLDPRSSTDPDDAPLELNYSWFINGESSIRDIDVPCVNLNTDFQLSAGNNTATLYVNDGFSYSADTIRFVIPEDSGDSTNGNGDDQTDDDGGDQNEDDGTDQGDDDGTDDGTTNQGTVTLTDPLNECDVDLRAVIVDESDEDADTDSDSGTDENGGGDSGTDGNSRPTITLSDDNPTFIIGAGPVPLVGNADIDDADTEDRVVSVTVSLTNSVTGDTLSLAEQPASADIEIDDSDDTTIILTSPNSTAIAENFETAIEGITFSYTPSGEDPDLDERRVSYSVNDGMNSGVATSFIAVQAN